VTIYINHGKTSSAEKNSGRKPKLSEKDPRMLKSNVSKNYRTAAEKVRQNSVFIVKALFPQKETVES